MNKLSLSIFVAGVAVVSGLAWAAEPTPDPSPSPVSRDLVWTGGDSLSIAIPADVQFTQGPASAVHITGPRYLVDRVVLRDGKLKYDRDMSRVDRWSTPMQVTMSAPGVKHFAIAGSKSLTIDRFRQDELDAAIAGSGRLAVRGAANRAKLTIAGSGKIDAGGLSSLTTSVMIAGSGDATVAPAERLKGSIIGSGVITLKTRPKSVDVRNIGSGRVIPASY